MQRRDFIKTLAGVSLLIPLASNLQAQENSDFSFNQLTGRGGFQLTKDPILQAPVYEAFLKLKAAGQKAGFNPYIVSGYRPFQRQFTIFENKFNRYVKAGHTAQEALMRTIEYSTIPGSSRHHWGTDFDIVDANKPMPQDPLLEEHFHGNGIYADFKLWLDEHANSFGFYEVYTNKPNRKGFYYEPWHFSYKPIAVPMLHAYQKLSFEQAIDLNNLSAKSVMSPEFLDRYYKENVLDINLELLPLIS